MKENKRKQPLPSSFRDPSGFIFLHDGVIYRQINEIYRRQYDILMDSGLYRVLTEKGHLIAHHEANVSLGDHAYKVLRPDRIPFISYPYEWCFSQLKDAALLTLKVQKTALKHGMTLKDASAYNVQFKDGGPVLIDTLSFEKYHEGPWVAYGQFCRHFLAPLALMAHTDVRLSQLLRVHIDGIPLDLASKLLPWKTRLMPSLMMHIHFHAKSEKKYGKIANFARRRFRMDRDALLGFINEVEDAIRDIEWKPKDGGMAVNDSGIHGPESQGAIGKFLNDIKPKIAWDIGGMFSRAASERGAFTVSTHDEPGAVEKEYRRVRGEKEKNILPLVIDPVNPSPAIGWENRERAAFLDRGPLDVVFAPAVYRLAISNNVPLKDIAAFFAHHAGAAVVEFVPKGDTRIKKLLAGREDIFPNYHQKGFEAAFEQYFSIQKTEPIEDSKRVLYLMRKR